MTLSVLTAFNSDPYIALMFKRSFALWRDEVDKLIICCHGENKEINEFIKSIFDDDEKCIVKISKKHFKELGQALDYIYPLVDTDLVATIDSDNFILSKGVMKKYKEQMSYYDVIGIKGLSCIPLQSANVIAKKNFGIVRINSMFSFWYSGKIDKLKYPTFKRTIFRYGEIIDSIHYRVQEKKIEIDTMSLLTMQYLANGNYNLKLLPNEDVNEYVHVGGMSSMARRFLGKDGISVYGLKSNYLDKKFSLRRLSWYWLFIGLNVNDCSLEDFNRKFIDALQAKTDECGYTRDDIIKEEGIIREKYFKNYE